MWVLLITTIFTVSYIFKKSRFFALSIIFAILLYSYFLPKPKVSKSITSINTNFTKAIKGSDYASKYLRLHKLVTLANNSKANIVTFPENTLSKFSKLDMMILSNFNSNKTILAGANIKALNSNLYNNVLIKFHKNRYTTIYKQRLPVPISMWGNDTKANLLSNPTVNFNNQKISVFICYEELVSLTYIHSLIHKPKLLLAISNLWWAKNTSIKNIQIETIQLWSLLFDIPYVFCVNG